MIASKEQNILIFLLIVIKNVIFVHAANEKYFLTVQTPRILKHKSKIMRTKSY